MPRTSSRTRRPPQDVYVPQDYRSTADSAEESPPKRRRTSQDSASSRSDRRRDSRDAGDSSIDESSDAMDVSTVSDASFARKARRGSSSKASDALFRAMSESGAHVDKAVRKWMRGFAKDGQECARDITNALCKICGAKDIDIGADAEFDNMESEEMEELAAELAEHAPEGPALLKAGRKKEQRILARNFSAFWAALVNLAVKDADEELTAVRVTVNLLQVMCECPIFGVRYTATAAAMDICSAIAKVLSDALKRLSDKQRQLSNAKKRNPGGQKVSALGADVAALEEQIAGASEIVEFVREEIFTKRFRDKRDALRCLCLRSLKQWMVACPERFFVDTYTKYVGWQLHDASDAVRGEAAGALLGVLHKRVDDGEGLKSFVEHFSDRLLSLVDDRNDAVQLVALGLLRELQVHGYLNDFEDRQIAAVHGKVFDAAASVNVRSEALSFLTEHVVEFEDADGAPDAQRLRVRLDALVRFSGEHIRRKADAHFASLLVEAALFDHANGAAEALLSADALADLCGADDFSDGEAIGDVQQAICLRMLSEVVAQTSAAAAKKAKGAAARAKKNAAAAAPAMAAARARLPALISRHRSSKEHLAPLLELATQLDAAGGADAEAAAALRELLRTLSDVFCSASAPDELQSVSRALKRLGAGDAILADEVSDAVQELAETCEASLAEVLGEGGDKRKKKKRRSKTPSAEDDEHALLAVLRRLRGLVRYHNIFDVIGGQPLFDCCRRVAALRCDVDAASARDVPLDVAAAAASEALWVLYYLVQWRYADFFAEFARPKGSAAAADSKPCVEASDALLALRGELVAALALALDMHLDGQEGPRDLSEEQYAMVSALQRQAFAIAGELRCLFGAPLRRAAEPLRRLHWAPAASFLVRLQDFFEAEERSLRTEIFVDEAPKDAEEDAERTRCVLAPLMKATVCNVAELNRRQAAAAVGHFVHSGPDRAEAVRQFTDVLRRHDGTRYLEVLLATLRHWYTRWVVDEPEEGDEERPPVDGDTLYRGLADRLAKALGGVGTLKEPRMQEPFLKFFQAAIAFGVEDAPERLSFLAGLVPFVRRATPELRQTLRAFADDKIEALPGAAAEQIRDAIEQGVADDDEDAAALDALVAFYGTLGKAAKGASKAPGKGGRRAAADGDDLFAAEHELR